MAKPIINLQDFQGDECKPQYRGILHAEGYQVATDGIMLVICQRPYVPEYEGKVVDGDKIKDICPPFTLRSVRSLIPADLNEWENVPIDYKLIETWYSNELIPWRKTQTSNKDAFWRGRVQILNTQYDATYLQKFLRVAKKIKAKDFYLSPIRPATSEIRRYVASKTRSLYAFGELDGQRVEIFLMYCEPIETKTLIIQ